MPYKYKSILKSFQYSKENYQVISDFLLSGAKSNPNILLNVTKITAVLKKTMKPKHWFKLSSTILFVKALIKIKLQNDKKLIKVLKEFIKSEGGNSALTQNYDFIDFLDKLDSKLLLKLMKKMS
jgi:hypothetical protein